MDHTFRMVEVNGQPFSLSVADVEDIHIHPIENDWYHFIIDREALRVRWIDYDMNKQMLTIEHDQIRYEIQIKGALEQQIARMGLDKVVEHSVQVIKAPMPGLVLEIAVSEGDVVEKGGKVLVLEAMKMENVITVPVQSIIKKIVVKPGAAVEKGQLLIELETA
ncbi:MAG TPA: acetyl-CoA carboxylase biotin carboxyl carrier protein subunit [Ferruginibacter sp.]|nr:acetyl-CoA carboxylase biotin carboxyl carrier protein subunit [Ferruginibacter sp.]HRO17392.1 acetyl-CoA carboxylase biotin carboxyl carrier protein subunit [Ferruginibacter sp.]HRQ20079.1 acetyl-CoA carboxylase biotin carboxyl carrier protein subunit [Ferruginibacter sp.]